MNLPFNWFDIAIPIVLIFGITRGRKHGMSEELLPVIKWLTIIIVCSITYLPIGGAIEENSAFSHLASFRMAYFGMAVGIALVFLGLTKLSHGKLVGSDIFGSGEYYLGMVAGFVRYCCIIIFCLAFLNARLYTDAEIKAALNYQNEWFGSDFFPTPQNLQAQVFEKSFTGPYIRNGLGFLLIQSTPYEVKGLKRRPQQELPE